MRGAGLIIVVAVALVGAALAGPAFAAAPVLPTTGKNALTDEVGHGTHVASLACADANNGIGMAPLTAH